jgi:hypothetical protein
VVAVAGGWPLRRKGEDTHVLCGQSATTQTTPKFGPRLHRRGHCGKNASGRWAGFFLVEVKIGPNWASAFRLHWAVGDALIRTSDVQ